MLGVLVGAVLAGIVILVFVVSRAAKGDGSDPDVVGAAVPQNVPSDAKSILPPPAETAAAAAPVEAAVTSSSALPTSKHPEARPPAHPTRAPAVSTKAPRCTGLPYYYDSNGDKRFRRECL